MLPTQGIACLSGGYSSHLWLVMLASLHCRVMWDRQQACGLGMQAVLPVICGRRRSCSRA